jgi:disease resistance protein RPM1
MRSLEIQVSSITRDCIQILAQLASLVNLRLHVRRYLPSGGIIIPGGAAFPKLKDLFFQCKVLCLVFEAGAMPRLENLTVECYSQAVRLAVGVLEGIEHLGSLNRCKVNIYERDNFMRTERGGGGGPRPADRWDIQTLGHAVRQAINKHPGCLEVTVQST